MISLGRIKTNRLKQIDPKHGKAPLDPKMPSILCFLFFSRGVHQCLEVITDFEGLHSMM